MSEHKSWLWKRRSSDKTTDKEEPSSKAHEQEIQKLLDEKAELEKDLKDLNGKLSSALSDSNANDELAKKNAKAAQEALADWERAEAKAHALKQELTEALDQKLATEERASQLDAALKECMQQLRFVREEQVRRVQDVLEKSEKDYEQKRLVLETELLESSKRIAELDDELVQLSRVLFHKDQLIEGLNQIRAKAEADIEQLIKRAESAEKACASLRYEVRVLEKEIEIRNEERDFNRVTADAAHKQHLENSKKIAKLESECQRLRVLVRKRLPGPAALAKMKNEVDVLERGPRKRLVSMSNEGSAGRSNSRLDYSVDLGSSPDSLKKKINVLVERLCVLEEDNNGLQESLMKTADELQVSKNMYARTATKLAQVESLLDESKKTQMIMELSTRRNGHGRTMSSHDFSTISDMETDDKGSCAGSWALVSVPELEKHKDGEVKGAQQSCKSEGASEINLMDDFVEMEKLALVCVDKPMESSTVSVTGSKLPLVDPLDNVPSDCRSPGDTTGKEIVPVSGPADVEEKPKIETSISKLIEIIEGINLSPQDFDRDSSTCYAVRVFRWKAPELALEIQKLLHCCYDSLNGKADFETFAQKAASALDWIINHCLSLEDVSNMKDAIRKQFDCKESLTENEPELGISKLLGPRGPPYFSLTSTSSYQGDFPQEELQKDKVSDIVKVKDEIKLLESSRRELEQKLGSTIDDGKPLPIPVLESRQLEKRDLNKPICTGSESEPEDISSPENGAKNKAEDCTEAEARCLELQLQTEGAMGKDVSEEHKNQEDEKQLQIVGQEHINHEEEKGLQTDWEIATASEKLAQCQEAILHLGKQLKALAPPHESSLFEKVMSSTTNTTATTKSTDSSTQSTIPTTQHKKNLCQRPSLLDRLLTEEDEVQAEELIESPQTKEIVVYASDQKRKPMGVRNGSLDSSLDMYEQKTSRTDSMKQNSYDRPVIGSLAIVPVSKRQNSGGLFKKLLRRKVK